MYTLKAENARGKVIDLTASEKYTVLEITGLNPPGATVNLSSMANIDGKIYNSAKMNERNITILIKILPPVEENRVDLYTYFKSKEYVKLYYKNAMRDVYIDGYVESFDCDFFTDNETAQVSILCPRPYFKDITENRTDFSQVEDLFEFPFGIEEAGMELGRIDTLPRVNVISESDTETGIVILLNASGPVKNPVLYNTETRGAFGINYTMQAGDQITVNTIKGEKDIQLLRAGEYRNLMNYIQKNPDWFQLQDGDNVFTFEAEQGAENLVIEVLSQSISEGV